MTWTCHRCAAAIAPTERVGRRETCPHCGSDLHCCQNCRFYTPGRHNDCSEPQAERQVDKEAGNFCEYFVFSAGPLPTEPKPDDPRAALNRLFDGRRAGGAEAETGGEHVADGTPGSHRAVGAGGMGGEIRREEGGDGAPPSRERRKM